MGGLGKEEGSNWVGGASPAPAPPPTLSPVTAFRQPALAFSFPPSGAAGPAGRGRTPGTRTRPPGPAGGGTGTGGPAARAATMEFRREEFRKLAGRTLGRLHR